MRIRSASLALALLLLTATAAGAAPFDPFAALYQWLWPPKIVAPLPVPVDPVRPPEPPIVAPPVAAPVESDPVPPPVKPKPKPKPKPARDDDDDDRPRAKARPKAATDHGADISCADARRAVGMPCFLIRSNAHVYESYTPKQKRQAQACLTATERRAIANCFKP